ncbi:MAG: carbon monoxide dehydrogenase [Thermoleophilia bacterium]|nr:carbon monoxide dehydrogenase [Thermoleophilia bacterium]
MRRAGRQVRELSSMAGARHVLRLKVGPGAGSGLVMKSDTFLELGSPTAGSCAFAVYTDRMSLVRRGRIRLIGPDVQESSADTVPFGQVIVAAGEALTEADYPELLESQYVGDRIEGFMVKSAPGRAWGRVSTEVAHRGFSLASLGSALTELVESQIPKVEAVEVLFVTSNKADLEPLKEIEESVSEIGRVIKERRWKERGIDISDCAFGGHCGSCPDRGVCDEVRKLAHIRGLV